MDYDSYRKAYFVDPPPTPRFEFSGLQGVALYFAEYEKAIAYYTKVLGSPAYVEGKFTYGWQLSNIWLTIFPSESGNPHNAEIIIQMASPAEAERLQAAFIEAGGSGEPPSDEIMYEPLRFCAARDPFWYPIHHCQHHLERSWRVCPSQSVY